MKYANIKRADVGNGEGIRISLFLSGCIHNCKGCFNKQAQDYNFGKEFNNETIDYIIELLKPSHIKGLSLLGGEPLDPINQPGVYQLIERVRSEFKETKDIWIWTGYNYPRDFNQNKRAWTTYTEDIFKNTDVLIDGLFIKKYADLRLNFRGSANQRVIDIKETLKNNNEIKLKKLNEPSNLVEDIYNKAKK